MPRFATRTRIGRFALRGGLLLIGLLAIALYAYPAAAQLHLDTGRQSRVRTFRPQTLTQRIQSHQLASTIQVLASQPPSVIIQFPLFPSGVKKAFPQATAW